MTIKPIRNDDDLKSVYLGADGAFAGMSKDAVGFDNTTASAKVARDLDAEALDAALAAYAARERRFGAVTPGHPDLPAG